MLSQRGDKTVASVSCTRKHTVTFPDKRSSKNATVWNVLSLTVESIYIYIQPNKVILRRDVNLNTFDFLKPSIIVINYFPAWNNYLFYYFSNLN